MACFCPFLHYIAHSSTRGFWTLTHAHGLMKGQEWLKLMEIVNCGKRNPNYANILNFDLFHALWARTTRARTDMYGREILKCSKWPETCSPLIRFWFWAILNFDTRARARRGARTCASFRARGQGLSVCWLMTWSLCVLNLVNLWRMDMKISMITWKTQNGAWMMSWLSDHTEKLCLWSPDNDKDTVNISTWLLILFLRYHGDKIHTERNNNINKNVNDVALIRHLATSNIANFMWYNFLLVKK